MAKQSTSGSKSPSRGSARGNSMNRQGPGNRSDQGQQSGSGGGPKVRQVGIRTGEAASGITPAAVSNLGSKQGNHATDSGDFTYRPTPWATKAPAGGAQKLGNEVALNVGRGGAGTGRTVYPSGSQSKTPAAVAPTSSGEIFPGFPGKRG